MHLVFFTMARGKQMTNNCISVIDYKCKQPQPCRTCWGEKRPAGTPCDKATFQSTAYSYCVFLDACATCLSSSIDGACGRGGIQMDTLGIEPRASRMLSGCDTTTPCARLQKKHVTNNLYLCPRTQTQTVGRTDKHLIGRGPSLPDPPPIPRALAPGRKFYTHQKRPRRFCLSAHSLALPLAKGLPRSYKLPSVTHAYATFVTRQPKITWHIIWKHKKSPLPLDGPLRSSW